MTYNIIRIKNDKFHVNISTERGVSMIFNTGAALLDAIVLAVVSKEPEGTYGYKITQEVRQVIELSESTLYPVLRRLQKDDCLEVYDMECAGRNRRYYKVTSQGWAQLKLYESEWRQYSDKITGLFEGRIL
jgi:PadR family transcriptional regulator PadR